MIPFGSAPWVTLRVGRSVSQVDESLGELTQVVDYDVWLGQSINRQRIAPARDESGAEADILCAE
jgi:hypothetical protein